jgi:hypothetical protein
MTDGGAILADPVAEAARMLRAAEARGVVLRLVGGIAIRMRAPSVAGLLPRRDYHDIDLAGAAGSATSLTELLGDLGYEASRRFNTMNGHERLLYWDPVNGRRVDVFLDVLRMCHQLPFRDRLTVDPGTLPLADLLLTKLQIVQLTERDGQDVCALLADHALADDDAGGIALPRIVALCSGDWGWWRTVTGNLDQLRRGVARRSHRGTTGPARRHRTRGRAGRRPAGTAGRGAQDGTLAHPGGAR